MFAVAATVEPETASAAAGASGLPEVGTAEPADQTAPEKKPRILIVDDDASIRIIVAK